MNERAKELGVDVNIIAEGIKDALTKAKPRLSDEQIQAAKIMDEYKDWIEYDEDNDINIANVYKTLSAR